MSASPASIDWHARAASLSLNGQAFVGGRYVPALSGKLFDCVNPATGKVLTQVAACDKEDVDQAVAVARAVFEAGSWSRMAPRERKKRLAAFAALIAAHTEELALLETLDMGKPIRDSLAVDLPLSAQCIDWYAEAIDKVYDEIAPTAPTAVSLIRREPLGVVAAVVPWNFPLLMAAWKLGPILAAGNSVILKPAEQSSLTAIRLGALAVEAGIPDGVFNVLPGFGETAGQALGLHMDVDAVAFTGSTEVGKYFLQYSGQSNMKRVGLECGGKSPNIILADAPDLDAAATSAAWGIFYNQGEVCNAGSRLVVEESVKDRIVEKVVEVGGAIKVGDPLDPATEMGAMVDARQAERVMGYIEKGVAEGAKLKLGGKRLASEGSFIETTLFDDVTSDMTIAREEIFGPVLATLAAKDIDEAIRIGNDTTYGLAAAVWTRDINKAFKASSALRAGVVWVNCFDHGDISSPFGGFKQSGFGRDKSLHALEKYTELKATWINLG
ncbi:aldehyde dehydrogenase [Ancylobacter defluvii]|uniref:Gamma-glutamyl-gamma-aminobutyraldehyde dehydrogenase n=1 Tax=Ancylobacter defluvii TaxID=1282440 RepID=A0A9W6NBN8_9HYPH|nr:aldehyde dehydrogenase [Ancylobacter defluvii]MBS7589193.1 aldehyde dehydrogenase [Ancylobacter defluvii]GLK84805.1 gamma-glutamyl-gamma-aminobutyraldehyde dehydrogenase [Ancylobacter defluvii]